MSNPRNTVDDRYEIHDEIGRGGIGVVHRGRDRDIGRDVAVKLLQERFSDNPAVLSRFIEEAQIGGQLQHPGIVPIYGVGVRDDQRPFFAMKLVEGQTLAALLAQRESIDVDRRRALGIFEQVCQTMAYAHSRNVVHRDLKPANVMVGAFGEVQVVDWGVAKVLRKDDGGPSLADEDLVSAVPVQTIRTEESVPHQSQPGSVLGTAAYMPPEQANSKIELVDERSDVFSLGATLCEILTGRPPYVEQDGDLLMQARLAELDWALESLEASGADQELQQLAKDCLAPAQEDRPVTAQVLADRMSQYLTSVEERARQAQVRAASAKARTRATIAIAGTVLFAVVSSGGALTWMQNRANRKLANEHEITKAALAKEAAAVVKERQAKAEALFQQGRMAAHRGFWHEALALYAQADEAGLSEVFDLQMARIEAEEGRQNVKRADEILATLQSSPRSPEQSARLLLVRGRLGLNRQKPKAGLELVKQALGTGKLRPADRLFAQALAASRLTQARDYLDAALREDPLHRQSLLHLGPVLLWLGDVERLSVFSRQLIRIYPADSQSILLYALVAQDIAGNALGKHLAQLPERCPPELRVTATRFVHATANFTKAWGRLRGFFPYRLHDPVGDFGWTKRWKLLADVTGLIRILKSNDGVQRLSQRMHPAARAAWKPVLDELFRVALTQRAEDLTLETLNGAIDTNPDGFLYLLRGIRRLSDDGYVLAERDFERAVDTPGIATLLLGEDAAVRLPLAYLLTASAKHSFRPMSEEAAAEFVVRHRRGFLRSLSLPWSQREAFYLWQLCASADYGDIAERIALRWAQLFPKDTNAIVVRAYNAARRGEPSVARVLLGGVLKQDPRNKNALLVFEELQAKVADWRKRRFLRLAPPPQQQTPFRRPALSRR